MHKVALERTLKTSKKGLPWWRSVWESTCKGHRFDPWSERIPHAAEQLGLCSTTTEPALLEPANHNYWACMPQLLRPAHLESVLCNKRSHPNEKPVHCSGEWPLLTASREGPHRSEDPVQPKMNEWMNECSFKEKKKEPVKRLLHLKWAQSREDLHLSG